MLECGGHLLVGHYAVGHGQRVLVAGVPDEQFDVPRGTAGKRTPRCVGEQDAVDDGRERVGVVTMGPQESMNCGIFWSTASVASTTARGGMSANSLTVAHTPSSAAIAAEIAAASPRRSRCPACSALLHDETSPLPTA